MKFIHTHIVILTRCIVVLSFQFSQPSEGENPSNIVMKNVGITKGWMITAGDVSTDGKIILLRNYLSKC